MRAEPSAQGEKPGDRESVATLRRRVSEKVDRVLDTLPRLRTSLHTLHSGTTERADELASLRLERDQLRTETEEGQRVMDLQMEIISTLHRQQHTLRQTILRYKKKAAARLEAAATLGKRGPMGGEGDHREVACQTTRFTAEAGVQSFEFLNECQEGVGEVRRRDQEYARQIEKVFQLLMMSRFMPGTVPTIAKKKTPKEPGSHAKTGGERRDPLAVELEVDSGVEDEGSVVFDGNLSPNYSDNKDPPETGWGFKKARPPQTQAKK